MMTFMGASLPQLQWRSCQLPHGSSGGGMQQTSELIYMQLGLLRWISWRDLANCFSGRIMEAYGGYIALVA